MSLGLVNRNRLTNASEYTIPHPTALYTDVQEKKGKNASWNILQNQFSRKINGIFIYIYSAENVENYVYVYKYYGDGFSFGGYNLLVN